MAERSGEWLEKPVLLSGASGFIGSRLHVRLRQAGLDVRCGTRDPERKRRNLPDRRWVTLDVEDPATLDGALEGCGSAYYLVHQMQGDSRYREREARAARDFRLAAERAGIRRIVYLGGVEPAGSPSEHLASRLAVGRILRDGEVSTVELRAAMILGGGSASWQIVRDLAARLPFMILPRWTRSRSQPVDVRDVVEALLAALRMEIDGSACFDLPGPEILTVEEILERTARLAGLDMRSVHVPLLSPRLSSHWLRFVTHADLGIARELVDGLENDLLARDDEFWKRIGHTELVPFDEAVRTAFAEEDRGSFLARAYEGIVRRVAAARRQAEGGDAAPDE